jgi:hypothetical protein
MDNSTANNIALELNAGSAGRQTGFLEFNDKNHAGSAGRQTGFLEFNDKNHAGSAGRQTGFFEFNDKNHAGSAGRQTSIHKGWYNRGYLPHYDRGDTLQVITYRLADSPTSKVPTGVNF